MGVFFKWIKSQERLVGDTSDPVALLVDTSLIVSENINIIFYFVAMVTAFNIVFQHWTLWDN